MDAAIYVKRITKLRRICIFKYCKLHRWHNIQYLDVAQELYSIAHGSCTVTLGKKKRKKARTSRGTRIYLLKNNLLEPYWDKFTCSRI